jgi:hypothetical protein
MLFRTAGILPAHAHDAGWKPAVRKTKTMSGLVAVYRDLGGPRSGNPYSTTLPPRVVQLTTSVVCVQPWPLQEFCPLHADEAVLQALVPLHELMPLHFTPPPACP